MVMGRIELAGVAIGLATSAKYPGILLLAPLVAAAWGRWGRLAAGGGLAVVAFAVTSPYVLLNLGRTADDAWRVQQSARDGWLGFEHDHAAPIAFVDRLWDGFGPVLLVAAAGLVVALVRRTRADLVLAVFCVVYFADLLTVDAHFDRYVLPLVPALGVLAGRIRSLAPVTVLLLAVPLTWSVRDARELTKTDARVVAHRWIDANLPKGARVAVDPSTPDLEGYRVLHLLLPRPGEDPDPNRALDRLRDERIRYLVLTGAVEDRVFAAREDYPRETRFVEETRKKTRRVYSIRPDRDLNGHWVEVYELS
jgi:hypothetical protein